MEIPFDKQDQDAIRKYLLKHCESIAAAESVTTGLLGFVFGSIPDASRFFQGSITAYNLGQKTRLLDVDPIHAEQCDCVSEEMACRMAKAISKKLLSDWGVAITGYATPVPESGEKLFAYYAIAYNYKIIESGVSKAKEMEPFEAQVHYVSEVLRKVRGCMKRSAK